MAEYKIFFTQEASTSVTVQADTLDEAIEEAYSEGQPGLCASCSGFGHGPGIDLSGDWNLDETSHYKNGEYIEGMEETS